MSYEEKRIASAPDAIAPDGTEVRVLASTDRGSMAHFTLPPKAVAKAVAHRTIDEVWYFLSGQGRMWRRQGGREDIVEVGPGVSITIPVGTHFQFRSDTHESLIAVGTSMPPWDNAGEEAFPVEGPWQATV